MRRLLRPEKIREEEGVRRTECADTTELRKPTCVCAPGIVGTFDGSVSIGSPTHDVATIVRSNGDVAAIARSTHLVLRMMSQQSPPPGPRKMSTPLMYRRCHPGGSANLEECRIHVREGPPCTATFCLSCMFLVCSRDASTSRPLGAEAPFFFFF